MFISGINKIVTCKHTEIKKKKIQMVIRTGKKIEYFIIQQDLKNLYLKIGRSPLFFLQP